MRGGSIAEIVIGPAWRPLTFAGFDRFGKER